TIRSPCFPVSRLHSSARSMAGLTCQSIRWFSRYFPLLVWLKDGTLIPVTLVTLREIVQKKCVTQKLVNHGTPDKPNWCVEYSPFLPNDMALRTACPSHEGVRGFPVTSAVHERLLDGDSDCACSAARWTTPSPTCPRNSVAARTFRRFSSTVATSREGLVERGGALFRRVGFIAANLIAFRRSKTVSKAVHAPPADGPCRKAGTVCVGVNLISA